jgi:hypothetical protein
MQAGTLSLAFSQPGGQASVFAIKHLAVHHEAQALIKGEAVKILHFHLLGQGLGHSGQAHGTQLVHDWVDQHSSHLLPWGRSSFCP